MSDHAVAGEPVAPFVKRDANGQPRLIGSHCSACGQTHLGDFDNCPACGAHRSIEPVELSDSGTLYNYTIVHRSLPGVTVPFISAVVDLVDGGTVRGNLLEVEPDPAKIEFDMPVQVTWRSAAEAVEGGDGYFAHFFVPANSGAN